jgi:hypothetical protein
MNTNYNNSKIYKIVDNSSDLIYIGSTCKTLEQRLKGHESNYKLFKAGKYHFITSFKILENNNYKIELIKNYPCISKKELELEEGKAIKQLKSNGLNIINKITVGQTQKEYKQNNKDKIYSNHTCSCGGKFTHKHKLQHQKSKKHQNYINNSKTTNNTGNTYNITININNLEELKQLEEEFLDAIK